MTYWHRWLSESSLTVPEAFLTLSELERNGILAKHSAESGKSMRVLEKDVWVCWALDVLFTMPGAYPMAFKGGTSLSKVFEVIARFSEDIDVTIDYRSLDDSVDPFAESTTNNQRQKLTTHLRDLVNDHVATVVAPHFRARLTDEFGLNGDEVYLDLAEPDAVWVRYPSALDDRDEYLADVVKLEFGGRNAIKPSESHTIVPYLADASSDLTFPSATVSVLAAERTFWEKATLIHAELGRSEFRPGVDRISRHWYDLDRLASATIGSHALANRELFADVVRVKSVFYRAKYADYDLCTTGGLRLIPVDEVATHYLHNDYNEMVRSNMFNGTPTDFGDILNRLGALAARINSEAL